MTNSDESDDHKQTKSGDPSIGTEGNDETMDASLEPPTKKPKSVAGCEKTEKASGACASSSTSSTSISPLPGEAETTSNRDGNTTTSTATASSSRHQKKRSQSNAGGRVRLPDKLLSLLNGPPMPNVFWWMPDGNGFAYNIENVQSEFLDKHFSKTKVTSFVRSLNRWGFRRVFYHALPENEIAFYHPKFKRAHPERVKEITMTSQTTLRNQAEEDEEEENEFGQEEEANESSIPSTNSSIPAAGGEQEQAAVPTLPQQQTASHIPQVFPYPRIAPEQASAVTGGTNQVHPLTTQIQGTQIPQVFSYPGLTLEQTSAMAQLLQQNLNNAMAIYQQQPPQQQQQQQVQEQPQQDQQQQAQQLYLQLHNTVQQLQLIQQQQQQNTQQQQQQSSQQQQQQQRGQQASQQQMPLQVTLQPVLMQRVLESQQAATAPQVQVPPSQPPLQTLMPSTHQQEQLLSLAQAQNYWQGQQQQRHYPQLQPQQIQQQNLAQMNAAASAGDGQQQPQQHQPQGLNVASLQASFLSSAILQQLVQQGLASPFLLQQQQPNAPGETDQDPQQENKQAE